MATEIQLEEHASSAASFVSTKLRGDRNWNNYESWKEQVVRLVESQGLIGYIDGKAPPPPPPPSGDDADYVAWRRTDWLVKGWILGALSGESLPNVVHLDSARDVWSVLENHFSRDPAQQDLTASSPLTSSSPAAEHASSPANAANMASTKLIGHRKRNNYTSWKEQMLSLLESHGLVGFIDGEAPPPPPNDIEWRRTDWLLKGCILGALSDEVIQNAIHHLDSARDIWLDLEKAFSIDQSQQGNFYHPPPPPPPSNDTPPPPFTYPGATPPPRPPLPSSYPAAPPQRINVANFVYSKLSWRCNWNNYMSWKEGMVRLVQSQGLFGFLDGGVPPPPPQEYNSYSAWKQTDGVVKGWIMEALSDELVQYVAHLDSAKSVWQELENEFSSFRSTQEQEEEWHEELELYKAARSGDWDMAEMILKRNPAAITKKMGIPQQTALHIAVGSGKSGRLVEELVKLSDDFTLSIRDKKGFNPLHIAAMTGNHGAAEILIKRLPHLLQMSSTDTPYVFPLHLAAQHGHRQTLELMMHHTRDDLPINPFAGQRGLLLLIHLTIAGFFDMVLQLVNTYPYLSRMKSPIYSSALSCIAHNGTTLGAHTQLNFWESLVYSCYTDEDEPPRWCKQIRKLQSTFWEFISELVPCVKRIHEMKRMRKLTRRLAKAICKHMESLGYERAAAIYTEAMLTAARVGNREIVEVIVETFPHSLLTATSSAYPSFLHVAVRNRSEKVFNLMYQTTNHRFHYSNLCDTYGNSMLHMAAFLAPPYKLNLVSGAALQMQREIQWFKEAEKVVSPHIKTIVNNAGQTPAMLFTEEHKDLKIQGEKWMKDTANSCTIAAALIVTVVFAAAITVPGGNESETGYPMMSKESAFTIFAVSDAISLFTSTTSLLMFLSILTSRYAEEDFLYALPKRLGIGLITLFLSILFMMAAFSSTVFLVFGHKSAWVLIPAAALTCIPISSFVLLQFPLLIAVISSTYGKGIFGKQSDRPFH